MTTTGQPLYLPEGNLDRLQPYLVDGAASIARLLDELVDSKSLISLYSPSDVDLFVISRVLFRSDTVLEFDLHTDRQRRRALEQHATITVVGYLDQVKLQFAVDIELIEERGENTVLVGRLPTEIYRIQRRDAYRIRPPIGEPAQLVVRVGAGMESGHDILDLSATGVAFRVLTNAKRFALDGRIDHARLELGPQVPIPASLLVKSATRMQGTSPGHDSFRIGAEFVDLPGPVARRIQVYVQDVERAIIRLRNSA